MHIQKPSLASLHRLQNLTLKPPILLYSRDSRSQMQISTSGRRKLATIRISDIFHQHFQISFIISFDRNLGQICKSTQII